MNHGLQFVVVNVPSVAAVRDFYAETLGFTVVTESPAFLQLRTAAGGGADYALSESADAKPGENPELWWLVDDADATYVELKGKGVGIASEPMDLPFGRAFAIHDPAGNTLHFWKQR